MKTLGTIKGFIINNYQMITIIIIVIAVIVVTNNLGVVQLILSPFI